MAAGSAIAHPAAIVPPTLMMVAKAVAGAPTWTERLPGNTAATSDGPATGGGGTVPVTSALFRGAGSPSTKLAALLLSALIRFRLTLPAVGKVGAGWLPKPSVSPTKLP